jgi:hypothetical protein
MQSTGLTTAPKYQLPLRDEWRDSWAFVTYASPDDVEHLRAQRLWKQVRVHVPFRAASLEAGARLSTIAHGISGGRWVSYTRPCRLGERWDVLTV